MSSFTEPLDLRFEPETDPLRPFILLHAFQYDVGEESSGVCVRVPAGFRTDFASIPKPFRSLFDPAGPYGKAAIVHDGLYDTVPILHESSTPELPSIEIPTRKRADDIFLEAMTVLGVGWWTRQTIYRAVRLFGNSTTKGRNW